MEKGVQYIQFMPGNGSCNPGPLYGPEEQVSVQLVEFEAEGFSMATSAGGYTFVLRNVMSPYDPNKTTKVWCVYANKGGKDTYTPVPGNESSGGYERFRVVSLKTVVDDSLERLEREEALNTMRKRLARKRK